MGCVSAEIEYICPQCGDVLVCHQTIDIFEIGNEVFFPLQHCDSQECFLSGQSDIEMDIAHIRIPTVDFIGILLF